MKDFFLFLKLLSQNFSPLRIFQIIELRKISVVGKTIEFGAQKKRTKKISHIILMKKELNIQTFLQIENLKFFMLI